MTELKNKKEILRKQYLSLRESIPAEKRMEMSLAIAKNLFKTERYNDAATIACYYAVRSEVSTEEILRHALSHGKIVYLPRTGERGIELCRIESLEGLAEGKYGIPEPPKHSVAALPGEVELFILPAVAVDRAGNRLGYGPGHYDRLLQNTTAIKAALAFSRQIADAVPQEPHDIAADMILTEEEVIECR